MRHGENSIQIENQNQYVGTASTPTTERWGSEGGAHPWYSIQPEQNKGSYNV